MNTFEVGSKLVDFCSQGKDLEAIETLDSANIVSVEAVANPNFPQRIEHRSRQGKGPMVVSEP